jgi:predicted glycogen debranching enzyme
MHNLTRSGQMPMEVQLTDAGVSVQAFPASPICSVRSSAATFAPVHAWYQNYNLSAEFARGLDHVEDHLHAATWHATLEPGDSITIVLSTNPDADLDGLAARERHETRERRLIQESLEAQPKLAKSSEWIRQLILAADQFVIARPEAADSQRASIIAGYPWFGEWGRDTMIALPGLLLASGRVAVAANVIREYARFVDEGMLPNRIAEPGSAPEYNTVDAALWFVEASRQYYAATGDLSLIREIFPVLGQIIESYMRGTRYNIHVDSKDGLVFAGEPGAQLTWMDAKIGDWVVTPRLGKPVEVNALWINALTIHTNFAEALGLPAGHTALLETARKGFQRFWNPGASACFDVIDGPGGNDASMRPNQIFAVSLGENLLLPEQQRAVVTFCRRELLTSFGLRSLAPDDPQYRGRYNGDVRYRDSSYHQGTVWGWLIGPFIQAFLRTGGSADEALSFLAPFENHVKIHGVGTASEIFDGDPPFAPQGCFAQAWTVAEILRAWMSIADSRSGANLKRSGTM